MSVSPQLRSDQLRKGWCPGALRPMQTGDGLLVRVKPRVGTLSIAALQTIADVADRFGNGEIDLTNRANLQVRGVTEASLPDVLAALNGAGLLDDTPEAEAVRNVIVDPLSGLANPAHDVRPLARAIELALQQSVACRALPGKFGVSVAGADAAPGWAEPSDVDVRVGVDRVEIQLDGDRSCAAVPIRDVANTVVVLAAMFADLHAADARVRRMRDAAHRDGAASLFQRAGLSVGSDPLHTSAEYDDDQRGKGSDPIARHVAQIGLPFGRITAAQLKGLSQSARDAGCDEVRLSPRRMLVFQSKETRPLLDAADQLGLIITSNDPRLKMDVCPGAPACASATTSTRNDANQLAAALQALPVLASSIHISGCAKGCARRRLADFTFVASNGLYDLVRNGAVDGLVLTRGIAPSALQQHVTVTGAADE
jgi:precorrin-3B synthase